MERLNGQHVVAIKLRKLIAIDSEDFRLNCDVQINVVKSLHFRFDSLYLFLKDYKIEHTLNVSNLINRLKKFKSALSNRDLNVLLSCHTHEI